MERRKQYIMYGILFAAIADLLSLVCVTHPELPAGETIDQWIWFDKAAISAALCVLFALFFGKKGTLFSLASTVSWTLIVLGSVEAIWGLRQLYGFTSSSHSLYALTGSFFNPGPYSGYLAMILPIGLHQWLILSKREKMLRQARHNKYTWEMIAWRVEYVAASSAILLILCVLPAGMSRSAWLAAGVSCLWVYGIHIGWGAYIREKWWLHKRQIIGITIGIMCLLLLAGYFFLILQLNRW